MVNFNTRLEAHRLQHFIPYGVLPSTLLCTENIAGSRLSTHLQQVHGLLQLGERSLLAFEAQSNLFSPLSKQRVMHSAVVTTAHEFGMAVG